MKSGKPDSTPFQADIGSTMPIEREEQHSAASLSQSMVAALYVEKDGAYFGLPGVDPWDEKRDARLYAADERTAAQDRPGGSQPRERVPGLGDPALGTTGSREGASASCFPPKGEPHPLKGMPDPRTKGGTDAV